MEGVGGARPSRSAIWSVVVALLATGILASCGSGEAVEEAPVEPVATAAPARTFAPLVQLQEEESSFPIDARRFLERATLKWKAADCFAYVESVVVGRIAARKEPRDIPWLDPRQLGREHVYRRRLRDRSDCSRPTGARYAADQLTRPYERDSARPEGLGLASGFYLDLLTASHDGDPSFARDGSQKVLANVPAYFEQRAVAIDGRRALRIAYWLLYGSSEIATSDRRHRLEHEGDWQRIDVLLERRPNGRYVPLSLGLHGGAATRTVPWRSVDRVSDTGAEGDDATHPVVLSSAGGHFPYPDAGSHERAVTIDGRRRTVVEETARCDDCAEWRTWRSLRRVDREPWYGFGGGWGLAWETSAESGPLGPTPR